MMKANQLFELYEGQSHGTVELLNKYLTNENLQQDGEFRLIADDAQFDVSYTFDNQDNGTMQFGLELLTVDGTPLYSTSIKLGEEVEYTSVESQGVVNEVYLWNDMQSFLEDLIERDMNVTKLR